MRREELTMTNDTGGHNRQILLTTIPRGKLTAEHFETRETASRAQTRRCAGRCSFHSTPPTARGCRARPTASSSPPAMS
jgi:hypothetical protein